DTSTGLEISPRIAPKTLVGFGQDGKSIIFSGDDGIIHEWDTATRRLSRGWTGLYNTGSRSGALLRPDGKVAAAVAGTTSFGPNLVYQYRSEPVIRLLDTATGKELLSLKTETGPVTLKFSPNGNLLASLGEDGIRLWN